MLYKALKHDIGADKELCHYDVSTFIKKNKLVRASNTCLTCSSKQRHLWFIQIVYAVKKENGELLTYEYASSFKNKIKATKLARLSFPFLFLFVK